MEHVLIGSLAGDGVVTGLMGEAIGAFRVEYFGEWSIGADALYLDETVIYDDGRRRSRNWAIQLDKHGDMVGYDAKRRGRLRTQHLHDRLRMVFDEPMGGAELATPRRVVDLVQDPDGSIRFEGRAGVFGLAFKRSKAVLRRRAEPLKRPEPEPALDDCHS